MLDALLVFTVFVFPLLVSIIFMYLIVGRYHFPIVTLLLGHVMGFLLSVFVNYALASLMLGEPIITILPEPQCFLSGGLSWTVSASAALLTLLKTEKEKQKKDISSYQLKLAQHRNTIRMLRMMFGIGLLSVAIGSFISLIISFIAYDFFDLGSSQLRTWILRVISVLISMSIAYIVFWLFVGRKRNKVDFPEGSSDTLVLQPIPVKLWSSRLIGFATFFFGFPSGIVLSSINWSRMGLKKKMAYHLVGGLMGIFVIVISLAFVPERRARGVVGLVNFGMSFYLGDQAKKDIEAFKAEDREVKVVHWFRGVLISLLVVACYFILIIVILSTLETLGFLVL